MQSILRISEAASLAIHAMVLVAERETAEPVNVAKVASWINASEAHLGKIFQWLAKAGLVSSTRGPKGGFRIAKDPAQISLLDIYEAIDGPFPTGICLLGRNQCKPTCHLINNVMNRIHDMVMTEFSTITIRKLIDDPNCRLHEHLTAMNAQRASSNEPKPLE